MEAEFKSTQRFVPPPLLGIFLKMAKLFILSYKCSFQPFQNVFSRVLMFVYVPYSINDYILANFNFQNIVKYCFKSVLLQFNPVKTDTTSDYRGLI